MNQIKVNYEELTLLKHASNLQALDSFIKNSHDLLESAPWQAVLKAFIDYKYMVELKSSQVNQDKYMTSIKMLLDEELSKKN